MRHEHDRAWPDPRHPSQRLLVPGVAHDNTCGHQDNAALLDRARLVDSQGMSKPAGVLFWISTCKGWGRVGRTMGMGQRREEAAGRQAARGQG